MKLEDARVLIGDDSILARKQLKDALSEIGVTEIYEASNGKQALDLFNEKKPDLVLNACYGWRDCIGVYSCR